VAEIAVALTLLTASRLLLRSFEKMRDVKLGFRPTIRWLRSTFCRSAGIDAIRDRRIHENSTERSRQLPGVDAVGIIRGRPAMPGHRFTIDGYVPPKGRG